MSQGSPNAESIFARAIEIESPEERAAFLDHACPNDLELRRDVNKLVIDHFRSGNFLENPAAQILNTLDEPIREGPGTVIGPYKLLQQIGEGGMGTVFMAEQTHPVQRKVAIKVIKPGMDSRQVIARFEAERQALAMMDHVNIARVLDAGTTSEVRGQTSEVRGQRSEIRKAGGDRAPLNSDLCPPTSSFGRPYFVMELVHGVPITKYCDDNHLTPRERLELFVPLCQAIQHAHQKGIIHRDIKPSNVMITLYDGKPVPKVIDFGVAKATEQRLTERTLFTQYGTMVGTLEYMSPEQAEMSALGVDTRSDIYSLGVLLYELLTGSTPLSRKRLREAAYGELLRMIREEEPPRPSARLSTTDELPSIAANRKTEPRKLSGLMRGELDWIVMKTLEKDRNRRYETANGLAMDVQRYLNNEQVHACPPSAMYRFRKFARRNRVVLTVAGLAGCVLLLMVVVGTVALVNDALRTERNLAQENQERAEKAELRALDAERQNEVRALLGQANSFRHSRRPGQRFESLDRLRQARQLAEALNLAPDRIHELRNAAIATLALSDLYLAGPWNTWPAEGVFVDFDEAYAIYARTDRRGDCSVRRVSDDAEIHYLPGLGGPAAVELSRDGKFAAIHHETAVHVWQLDASTPRRLLSEENAFSAVFRDSQQVAVSYRGGEIRVFELPGGRQLCRLAPDTLTHEVNIAIHPAEPLLAVCSYFGPVVQVRDVQTQKVLATLPQSERVTSVAWHPNGRTLAVGYAEAGQIRLYERATWQVYQTLKTGQAVTKIDFNHSGDRLAINGWDGILQVFDTGTGQKRMVSPPNSVTRPRFSRDGRRLAGGVQNGKLGIWQIADGQEFRSMVHADLPQNGWYRKATVSPDGGLLAVAMMSEGFGLWDLASGRELAFISSFGIHNSLQFEPSGSLLTLSSAGLARWPIAKESDAPGEWVIGPPQYLPLPVGHVVDQSRDGRVIVTCDRATGILKGFAGGWILHSDRRGEPIRIDRGADIAEIAVSPDGRWVVTLTHGTRSAQIWDARDGQPVRTLADSDCSIPRFSPDGRWLTTGSDGGRLFAVGTWEPGPQVGNFAVFAPDVFTSDRKLVAVPMLTGIRLADQATGREVAILEEPDPDLIVAPTFTPDGTKLISMHSIKGIRIWDLRLIREHLKELGLDWDWPEFAPADRVVEAEPRSKVQVLYGDRAQKARQEIDQFRRAVEADPNDALACNNLAWYCLTAPESLRDVNAALPLAETAVRLATTPSEGAIYRNTLGLAYYRAGRFREAVDCLEQNLNEQQDSELAFDLYLLAMSCHKLHEPARARDYQVWANRWVESRAKRDPHTTEQYQELAAFRAETEEVLGVKEKPTPEESESKP
jgi:serine/threonine protein kinase/WD40 repeat protein